MHKIDSELLMILRSLTLTQSQKKTAQSLGVSQSSISREVSRARELFNDPLFVRKGQQLAPTPRMIAINQKIPHLLAEVDSLFDRDVFEPRNLRMHLRIAAIDYAVRFIVLPAFNAMRKQAPEITLEIQHLNDDVFQRLSIGLCDFAVRLGGNPPSEVHALPLYEARNLLMVRKGHPLEALFRDKGRIEREDINRYGVAFVNRTFSGFEWTESFREEAGIKSVISMPYPGLLPFAILDSDVVAHVPGRFAIEAASYMPITLLPPPKPESGIFRTLFWHERTHYDPAMQWVRSMIATYGAVSAKERADFNRVIGREPSSDSQTR